MNPLRIVIAIPLLAIAATGCTPIQWYQPPQPFNPHAIVDLTIRYHSRPGAERTQWVRLNRRPLREAGTENTGIGEGTRRIPIWAMDSWFDFQSAFYQTVSRQEPRPFTRYESYSCGTARYPRMCTRTVTTMQWVTVLHRLPMGSCRAGVSMSPHVGDYFRVEYDFMGPGNCTARCLQQVATPAGPAMVPCTAAINQPPPLPNEESDQDK